MYLYCVHPTMPANKVVIVYIANSLLYQENTQRITRYNSLIYQQHAQRITHYYNNSILYQQHVQRITHLARRPDRVAVGYSVKGGGLLEARACSTCCSRLGISSVVSVLFATGFWRRRRRGGMALVWVSWCEIFSMLGRIVMTVGTSS